MRVFIVMDIKDRPIKVFAEFADAKEYMDRYNKQFPNRTSHIEPYNVNYGQVM